MKNWLWFILGGFLATAPLADTEASNQIIFYETSEDSPALFGVLLQTMQHSPILYYCTYDHEFAWHWNQLSQKLLEDLEQSQGSYALSFQLSGPVHMQFFTPFLEQVVSDFLDEIPQFEEEEEFTPLPHVNLSLHTQPLIHPLLCGWGDDVEEEDLGEKSSESRPFFALPLSTEDKRNIRQLISLMADKNLAQLFIDQKNMERLGDKVRHIHPMRFIGFILADSYLRKCLQAVEGNSLKWSRFIEGYETNMKKEAKENNVLQHAPGFAELLDVETKVVRNYLKNKDYIGLVRYFL